MSKRSSCVFFSSVSTACGSCLPVQVMRITVFRVAGNAQRPGMFACAKTFIKGGVNPMSKQDEYREAAVASLQLAGAASNQSERMRIASLGRGVVQARRAERAVDRGYCGKRASFWCLRCSEVLFYEGNGHLTFAYVYGVPNLRFPTRRAMQCAAESANPITPPADQSSTMKKTAARTAALTSHQCWRPK
jgi:hypothetical protein